MFGSASNPELESSKPLGVADGLKKPLPLLWIPGSCNCKTPEETYNSLSKQAKNLQQPTGRALVQTWSAARVSQRIHSHPATVMEAARTSSRRMPDHQGESGRPAGTTEGQSFTNDTLTSFNSTIKNTAPPQTHTQIGSWVELLFRGSSVDKPLPSTHEKELRQKFIKWPWRMRNEAQPGWGSNRQSNQEEVRNHL